LQSTFRLEASKRNDGTVSFSNCSSRRTLAK
jgi:hypothetical protein